MNKGHQTLIMEHMVEHADGDQGTRVVVAAVTLAAVGCRVNGVLQHPCVVGQQSEVAQVRLGQLLNQFGQSGSHRGGDLGRQRPGRGNAVLE